MNAFKISLHMDECIWQQLQDNEEGAMFDLVNPTMSNRCGLLKIESVPDPFPKSANQKNSDAVKRKAVGGYPNEKKAKTLTLNSQTLPPKSLPAGATMGKVTPTFGTMPDGSIICPVCTTILKDMKKAKRHYESVHSGIVFVCELCQAGLLRPKQTGCSNCSFEPL